MTQHRCHSHYETLRVDRGATPQRLRTAYRLLAQKFHPDKHDGKSAAATVMALINQAHEVLSDPVQRARYDCWLAAEEERLRSGGTPGLAGRFVPDRFGWAGWLVWATVSVAVLTVGFVVLRTWAPAQAPLPRASPAGPSAPAAATEPPVPAQPVQPGREPARNAAPTDDETDPIRRRVGDGTITAPQPRTP